MGRERSDLAAIHDPARRATAAHARLRAVEAQRARLVGIRREAVAELRAAGWSWQDIGSLLGLHRNRAAHLLDR